MSFVKIFIFGLLASLGALTAELFLSASGEIFLGYSLSENYSEKITVFLFIAVLLEEMLKLLLLIPLAPLLARLPPFASALSFALGFSFWEILPRLFSDWTVIFQTVFSWDFARIFLIHLLTSWIIVFWLSQKKRVLSPVVFAILFPVFFFHLSYNIFIIYEFDSVFISTFLFIPLFALFLFTKLFPQRLAK